MIICAAKCRHRAGDGCALERSGMAIILNGIGQCELKEDPLDHPILIASPCSHEDCETLTDGTCTLCSGALCTEHALIHPVTNLPMCTSCWLRYGPDLVEERHDRDTDGARGPYPGP